MKLVFEGCLECCLIVGVLDILRLFVSGCFSRRSCSREGLRMGCLSPSLGWNTSASLVAALNTKSVFLNAMQSLGFNNPRVL